MKTQIKNSFANLFINGSANANQILTVFLVIGLPVIIFFVGSCIINHVK